MLWGIEEKFLSYPGVLDTEVGYTGGITENPAYVMSVVGQLSMQKLSE